MFQPILRQKTGGVIAFIGDAMDIPLRKCARCKKEKPGYEFSICTGRRDGLNTRCRQCIKDTHRPSELEIIRKNLPERAWNY